MLQFTLRIDGEYANYWNADRAIRPNVLKMFQMSFKSGPSVANQIWTHIYSVSVARVERILREESFDVAQTGDFELLRLSLDDFAMEG